MPADPWRPDEREDYLAAVMATGPPPQDHLPAEQEADDTLTEQDAIALLVDMLGARVLEHHEPSLATVG